jgi:hypothetical protein
MTDSLSNGPGLITANIIPKTQTYHLVTEETLSAIKEKSTVADVLMLITSLLFGAFFSVLITLNASVGLPKETAYSLSIYQWVFFGFGILFFLMTVFAVIMGNKIIKSVKSPETTLVTNAQQP